MWYYPTSNCLNVNALLSNIAFWFFLQFWCFTHYESPTPATLHTRYKLQFLHLLLLFYYQLWVWRHLTVPENSEVIKIWTIWQHLEYFRPHFHRWCTKTTVLWVSGQNSDAIIRFGYTDFLKERDIYCSGKTRARLDDLTARQGSVLSPYASMAALKYYTLTIYVNLASDLSARKTSSTYFWKIAILVRHGY